MDELTQYHRNHRMTMFMVQHSPDLVEPNIVKAEEPKKVKVGINAPKPNRPDGFEKDKDEEPKLEKLTNKDLGTLKVIKRLLKEGDLQTAHDLAVKLHPHHQHIIPAKEWEKLIHHKAVKVGDTKKGK